MAHTMKDIPKTLKHSAWDKYENEEPLSEQELAYIKRYTRRKSQRRKHGRLMRTYEATYCGDRKCCSRVNVVGVRAKEKREWKSLVLLSI